MTGQKLSKKLKIGGTIYTTTENHSDGKRCVFKGFLKDCTLHAVRVKKGRSFQLKA